MYASFSSKDLLFDAVLESFLDGLIVDVPLNGHALGDDAVGRYDAILRTPMAMLAALALTWSPAATMIAAAPDDSRAEHDRRRPCHRAWRPPPA